MQSLENYTPYLVEDLENDEIGDLNTDDTDKIVVVMGLFRTIINIVESIKSNSTLLAQVDQIMSPLVAVVLQKQVIDLYEDMFDYLETVTFNLKIIMPHMWSN